MSDYKKYKTLEEIRHQQLYDELFEMMVKKDLGIAQQELVVKETQLRSNQAA